MLRTCEGAKSLISCCDLLPVTAHLFSSDGFQLFGARDAFTTEFIRRFSSLPVKYQTMFFPGTAGLANSNNCSTLCSLSLRGSFSIMGVVAFCPIVIRSAIGDWCPTLNHFLYNVLRQAINMGPFQELIVSSDPRRIFARPIDLTVVNVTE